MLPMKLRAISATVAIVLAALLVLRTPAIVGRMTGQDSAKLATPVLVELFTSEGCSSCPPADKLLAQIGTSQPVGGAQAIILEEHVDYWNDLGWRDPFASSSATQRQQEYSKTLNAEVYTPQMIVDGRTELLGSDGRAAQRAIANAVVTQKTDLELTWVGATSTVGGPKLLRVRAGKLAGGENGASAKNAEVFMAITENHLHSDVRRGENAGRGLEHDGVVRKLSSLGKANGTGDSSYDAQTAVKLSPDWKRENVRIVVFVQDTHTRHIYAASSTTY